MAAPTATARVTPPGAFMENGFSALLTFAADPNIDLWERSVTPAGIDGGAPVEIGNMYNAIFNPKVPRDLASTTEGSAVVQYDAAVLGLVVAIINVHTVITVKFPNGDTWAFYGYLKSFRPNELADGTAVTANITFEMTNWDYTNHVEANPVFTAAP